LPFPLSIALGAAVKCNKNETIESVMALADERMYENKKQMVQRTK
jgi:GGDEF domain-containing protein